MKKESKKESKKIISILEEQLKSYSGFTILAALDELGLLAPTEPSEDKPLTDTDRVEYLPADAWSNPKPEGGCMKRTVKEGKRGTIKIYHADGTDQTHPRAAEEGEGYPADTNIYRCSDYISFPAWPQAVGQDPQHF